MAQPGRYQLEAAIHSQHADRLRTGRIDWPSIHQGYRLLVANSPTLGAIVSYAASFGRIGEPLAGLEVLDELDAEVEADRLKRHQPYWAVRAWLAAEGGCGAMADEAYGRAIGLASDPQVRDWLTERRRQAADRI
jgi:RNA polymerase sigma-70 factor (ECF subfamily)